MFPHFATVVTVIHLLEDQIKSLVVYFNNTGKIQENWSWIQNWVGVYMIFTQWSSQQIIRQLERQYSCMQM